MGIWSARGLLTYFTLSFNAKEAQSGCIGPDNTPMFAIMPEDDSIVEPQVFDQSLRNDDKSASDISVSHVPPMSHDEPIVTRKELWSYYCKLCGEFLSSFQPF
jgi:hypothetical protein